MDVVEIVRRLESLPARSVWKCAVRDFAIDLVSDNDLFEALPGDASRGDIEAALLSGAANWREYSYGGCGLVYNGDIDNWLMTPSELKRYNRPGHDASMGFGGESLLDMQARALSQAARLAFQVIRYPRLKGVA
ncbi:hypothetical protein [Bifidobacterium oedipodis]|uniref:Uncharacterized protein n=1 Tax=Bifidobacterium oedipodis TaxID=2675322 RepID=A0A7Y0HRC2_9BIFI|nr:hypothetical protein [Bifidobacterium sp. DSM 109957]NMM93885.1 hypothetical protein [Bifidobacterium sp. DSM 109957]